MIPTLRKRAEFLALRKCPRHAGPAFTLQGKIIDPNGDEPQLRIGYTVTTKTGSSVERSRIKRRLREAFKLAVSMRTDVLERKSAQLVLVARRRALYEPFGELVDEITKGIDRLAAKGNKAAKTSTLGNVAATKH